MGSSDFTLSFDATSRAGDAVISGHELELTGADLASSSGIAYVSQTVDDVLGDNLGSALVIIDNVSGITQLVDGGAFAAQPKVLVTVDIFAVSAMPAGVYFRSG